VQRMRTHFGDRAFSAAGPWCWNSLPPVIRLADSVHSFKVQLKTYLTEEGGLKEVADVRKLALFSLLE